MRQEEFGEARNGVIDVICPHLGWPVFPTPAIPQERRNTRDHNVLPQGGNGGVDDRCSSFKEYAEITGYIHVVGIEEVI